MSGDIQRLADDLRGKLARAMPGPWMQDQDDRRSVHVYKDEDDELTEQVAFAIDDATATYLAACSPGAVKMLLNAFDTRGDLCNLADARIRQLERAIASVGPDLIDGHPVQALALWVALKQPVAGEEPTPPFNSAAPELNLDGLTNEQWTHLARAGETIAMCAGNGVNGMPHARTRLLRAVRDIIETVTR